MLHIFYFFILTLLKQRPKHHIYVKETVRKQIFVVFYQTFLTSWHQWTQQENYSFVLTLANEAPLSKILLKYNWMHLHIPFLLKFFNRVRLGGTPRAFFVFECFLQYLKLTINADAASIVPLLFVEQSDLPFKINVVTFSNRHYLFPGPFFSIAHIHTFFFKKYGIAIKKRLDTEKTFNETIFNELVGFLQQENISFLQDILDNVYEVGLENRAYVHYRWLLKN